MATGPLAMPITPFQAEVLKVIARNRNPDSYLAGGIVINRDNASARFSNDIDVFHATAQAVAVSTDADTKALKDSGFAIHFLRREETFQQAEVSRDGESVRLDWATDSAFRFFPIVPDDVFGYRLHDADAATNKVLAAVSRQKVRDFIDLMQLDRTYISLGIAAWAAAAKDEGYTALSVMQELRRNSLINPATLGSVKLASRADAVALKSQWLESFAAAERLIATIPLEPIQCIYLGHDGQPARGEVFDPSWTLHYGSVGGAWPKIVE
jgi:hypothetical protein